MNQMSGSVLNPIASIVGSLKKGTVRRSSNARNAKLNGEIPHISTLVKNSSKN